MSLVADWPISSFDHEPIDLAGGGGRIAPSGAHDGQALLARCEVRDHDLELRLRQVVLEVRADRVVIEAVRSLGHSLSEPIARCWHQLCTDIEDGESSRGDASEVRDSQT